MPVLLHLNGPPGIGKSTLARRYVAEHPGTLNCDIDVLRTLVGGWEEDFQVAGALIRPAAIALMESYLGTGHDVVLPQLLADPGELDRFHDRARAAGAEVVEVWLMTDAAGAVERFTNRGSGPREHDDPWHDQVRAIVAAQGGRIMLADLHSRLVALLGQRPQALVIDSRSGEPDDTYDQLVAALAVRRPPRPGS